MDTAQYKEKLLAEKKRLESGLSNVGRKTGVPGDWEATPKDMNVLRADVNETADEMEEYETRIAIDTTLEEGLAEVSAALARIEGGTYGSCRVCGKTIEEDRLSANPAAATCKAHIRS